MNVRLLLATGVLATGLIAGASGISTAQSFPAPGQVMQRHMRGERGSARNLVGERRRLEGVIDQLTRDRHDYGGHRETAIDLLQRARTELDAAIQYDATHPGQ